MLPVWQTLAAVPCRLPVCCLLLNLLLLSAASMPETLAGCMRRIMHFSKGRAVLWFTTHRACKHICETLNGTDIQCVQNCVQATSVQRTTALTEQKRDSEAIHSCTLKAQ